MTVQKRCGSGWIIYYYLDLFIRFVKLKGRGERNKHRF